MNTATNKTARATKPAQIGTPDLPKFLKEFDHRRIGTSHKERFMQNIRGQHTVSALTFRSQIARAWAQILTNKKAKH